MSSRPFDVRTPLERAYTREGLFAVELVDSVTLERVTHGVQVTARGLTGQAIVNHGGLFVWLQQDTSAFTGLQIDPGVLPFEPLEVPAAQVVRPLHTVQLRPLASYPFVAGLTVIRGALIETLPALNTAATPVPGAKVRLEWLDDDGVTWHAGQASTTTDSTGGFTLVLRLAPGEDPRLNAQGEMSVRLYMERSPGNEKFQQLQLPQGRVRDAIYAWDQL